MNQAMRGEPFTIFGDGEQRRAFSYISDVAPIIARSVDCPGAYGETFNIGGDVPYTVNYLAQVVADAIGQPFQVKYLPARNEVVDAFSSHSRAQMHFGHLLQNASLEDGVQWMAAWARHYGSRRQSLFAEIEVWKNMPPSWRAAYVKGHPTDESQ